MKRFIFSIVFVIVSVAAFAQTEKKPAFHREGDNFVQDKTPRKTADNGDQVTAYTWTDTKGVKYPIVLHEYKRGEKSGRVTCYVVRTSAKTGKEYKYYLPDGETIAAEILRENK